MKMPFRIACAACALVLGATPLEAQLVPPSGAQPRMQLPANNAPVNEAAADKFMAEGNYSAAADAYSLILQRNPDLPQVLLKFGDALNQLAYEDYQNLYRARQSWERAVDKDPQLLQAHQRLMQLWLDLADLAPGTRGQYLNKAIDTSERILQLDPNDKRAKFVRQMAVIELYVAGAAADPQRVVDAIAALESLAPDDPDNLDIPFEIARGQGRLALDALKLQNRAEVDRLVQSAVATMDAAIKQKPDNCGLVWRKAQVLHVLVTFGASDEEDTATREKRARQQAQVAEMATTAFNHAQPDDPDFVPMGQYAAAMQQRSGFTDNAERIYRRLLDERPDESAVKLQLVELLRADSSRADETVKLLQEAAAPPKPRAGLGGLIAFETRQRAQVSLLDARLEQYFVTRERGDGAAAAAMLPAIEADLNRLNQQQGNTPNMLRLRGKMLLFKGDTAGATEILNRAMTRVTDPNDRLRYEIMYLLARAYQRDGNKEDAEKMYGQVIERLDFAPARKELARLLLAREAYPEARPHIDALKKSSGDDPEVLQFQMAMLQWEGRGDSTAMLDLLEKLPEDGAGAQVQKARLALVCKHPKVTIRLIEPLYRQYKDDARLLVLLANGYEADGDVAKALEILKEYDSRHKDDPPVKKVIERLEKN